MDNDLENIKNAVVKGDIKGYKALVEAAKTNGKTAHNILDSMGEAMAIVGDLYAKGNYYLPQVLLSAETFTRALAIITPDLKASVGSTPAKGKIVCGVCEGDVHEIGKKLVATLIGAAGFEVIDLGKDVKLDSFVDTAVEQKANVIAMSALMTTTMTGMKTVVDMLNERGLRGNIKTMIGGAPITQLYADTIGADAYGPSAQIAVEKAALLCSK